ncbi:unnamed protein product, partial [Meganyctiphanes norvegica]
MGILFITKVFGELQQGHQILHHNVSEVSNYLVTDNFREPFQSAILKSYELLFSTLACITDKGLEYGRYTVTLCVFVTIRMESVGHTRNLRCFTNCTTLCGQLNEGLRNQSVWLLHKTCCLYWGCLSLLCVMILIDDIAEDSGTSIRSDKTAALPKKKTGNNNIMSALKQEIIDLKDQGHTVITLGRHHIKETPQYTDDLDCDFEEDTEIFYKANKSIQRRHERCIRDISGRNVAHFKRKLDKVDSWLSKDGSADERIQEIRRKLEEAYQANRGLKQSLNETTTNMGMLRSDLAEMRMGYEEKCRELHSERETSMEYMHQFDHMKRQLELLHEANKRLQDTNDSMRGAIEVDWKRSPFASKCSSARSSFRRERKRSHRLCAVMNSNMSIIIGRSRSPQFGAFLGSSTESEGELKYGIKRLMDDLVVVFHTRPDKMKNSYKPRNINNKYIENDKPRIEERAIWCLESADQKIVYTHKKNPILDIIRLLKYQIKFILFSKTPPHVRAIAVPLFDIYIVKFNLNSCEKVLSGESYRIISGSGPDRYIPYGPPDRTYKVVFAGDAAVGKSTFITRICQNIFVNNIASTLVIGYQLQIIHFNPEKISNTLWPAASQERFRSITKTYFRRADGVLLLFDVTSERSYINIRQWIQSIDDACECRVPLVLCGNKSDLRVTATAKGRTCITEEDGEKLARECGASYFETSSKTGLGVLDALVDLSKQMMMQEDVAVQTSVLHVREPIAEKSGCCSGTKKK